MRLAFFVDKMKRILFRITYFLLYPLKVEVTNVLLIAFTLTVFFIFKIILILIKDNGTVTHIDYFMVVFLYFMLIPIIVVKKYFKQEYGNYEKKIESNPIKMHQTENLQEYEDLKTHYALHNIKNSTKNMDWTLKSLDIQNFTEQDLDDLNSNIKRIYDTLDDFNKLNNIREQKEFKVQELADIFNKLIRPSVKTKEIKFSFTYQTEDYGNWNIEQNFYDVFQIFNNLIINAEKAMEIVLKKELSISVGEFDGTNLIFYVRDTGVGISEENRKKVFKESFSTTGGTGIGLMYIRDELKKIGGQINLTESNEQFSTIFEVKIPIKL